MLTRLALTMTFMSKFSLTQAQLSCNLPYNEKTLISALSSRISTLEYSQASLEETSSARISALESQVERLSIQKENGPFEDLEGWTKIESDSSEHLFYKLMDFHGTVDFLGAQSVCKEFRADSHLAEVHTEKEKQGLNKLVQKTKKHYWLNGYNSKPTADKLIDYIWLHSGKKVSPNLWKKVGNEGANGSERVLGFHSTGEGFFDYRPDILYCAVCELRSD